MRGQKVLAERFEFYFADLDNSILVERAENGHVTIRAVRDNVSEGRKAFFIRQLATEGFIPDMYQWFHGSINESCGIQWITDYTWMKIHPAVKRRARVFMSWTIGFICAIWILLIGVLLVSRGSFQPDYRPATMPNHSSAASDLNEQQRR